MFETADSFTVVKYTTIEESIRYRYHLVHLLLPFTPLTESRAVLLLRKYVFAEKGQQFFDFAPPYESL